MSGSGSILIIEDEEYLRASLVRILQKEGYQTLAVGTGREALECLSSQAVDLVILDLKLPDISGLDLLPCIQQASPNLRIIILSASSDHKTVEKAKKKGVHCFLVKPTDPAEILEDIRWVLV